MTTARTLARATRHKLAQVVTVPPAAGEMVENILAHHFKIHGALAALRQVSEWKSVVVEKGYVPTAPDLTDQEWAQLAQMMADGRLPLMHSFPELTRALLKLCEDKP
jgi:alanine-alpha-ketoisovalerate/valine-pyruvate aminotransferase